MDIRTVVLVLSLLIMFFGSILVQSALSSSGVVLSHLAIAGARPPQEGA